MNTPSSQQEQHLHAQFAHVNEKIVAMDNKLRTLDGELANLRELQSRYALLNEVCASLEKLNGSDAASLFRESTDADPARLLQQVREATAQCRQKISDAEKLRSDLQSDLKGERTALHSLNDQLLKLRGTSQGGQTRQIPEQKPREISYRPTAMPWSTRGEDERRFRVILFTFLSFAIAFGGLIPIIRPPVEKSMGMVVPERIARIIKKKQEAKLEELKKPEKKEEKKEEKEKEKEKIDKKLAEKAAPIDAPKPSAAEVEEARKSADTKGVLAFKENFADIMDASSQMQIGAAARISSKANRNASGPQRSLIMSQSTGGSGGIDTATISRQIAGGGGGGAGAQRIVSEAAKFTRVESNTSAAERPLSQGGTPTRTDEEIQIIFDRYKSALYRIYNRELRSNPTLRGKMVLQMVIEPDGSVSSCTVKSSDMKSATLSADVVSRVLSFNFGVKEGVPAVTILYPIDFLPTI